MSCRELGYWVGEPYWNRGIATKAIALITEHAFRELGLHRVEASVLVHNVASRKALEKNGFRLEGTAIQGAWKDGAFVDEWRLAKLSPH